MMRNGDLDDVMEAFLFEAYKYGGAWGQAEGSPGCSNIGSVCGVAVHGFPALADWDTADNRCCSGYCAQAAPGQSTTGPRYCRPEPDFPLEFAHIDHFPHCGGENKKKNKLGPHFKDTRCGRSIKAAYPPPPGATEYNYNRMFPLDPATDGTAERPNPVDFFERSEIERFLKPFKLRVFTVLLCFARNLATF